MTNEEKNNNKICETKLDKTINENKMLPRLVVYQCGNIIIAKYLETGKTTCFVYDGDDAVNFDKGAFIAVSKLTGHSANLDFLRDLIYKQKELHSYMEDCINPLLEDKKSENGKDDNVLDVI